MKPAMRPSCPSCGKTIFNKRYPKCEFCGFALPEGLALTTEERNRLLEQERAVDDAAWLTKRRAQSGSVPAGGSNLGDFGGSASGSGCDSGSSSGGDGSC